MSSTTTTRRSFGRRLCLLVALQLALITLASDVCLAQGSIDRVRRRTGVDTGKITKVSALGITLEKNGVEKKIPVEEIVSVYYANQPQQLKAASQAILRGKPKDALETLDKIDRSTIGRDEILQEIDFISLRAKDKLALSGTGSMKSVVEQAKDFLSQNRSSYHVSEVIELLGQAHLAAGDSDEALNQFRKLAKAPSKFFRARSSILIGRVLQQQGDHQEALAEFDKALAAAKDNAAAESELFKATLYRAVSQSALGDVGSATTTVKSIIKQADSKDIEVLAAAYNALGDCYLQSDKQKAARDAYLHVDLLFHSSDEHHAKALYELSRLWTEFGHEGRASDARERLMREYPASRWARM